MPQASAAPSANPQPRLGRSEPGTIAICFVAAALEAVRERQIDAHALLAQVGLSPGLLEVPQARVSAKHYADLWRLVARTLDDEFFGQDSRRMKGGSFALLVQAVVACRTLGHGLERSLRFFAILLDDIEGRLVRGPGEASIVLRQGREAKAPRIFGHETLLMLLHGVACWLVGRRIPILRARFAYPEPAHSAEYRLMYCTDLEFSQAHTSISFEAGHLDLPVVQNERSVREFLRGAPENILVKYKNGSSLSARVRRRVRQTLPWEAPTLAKLAAELKMTVVTLRRRLHQEGTSYQEIKDGLRRDIAIRHLSHSDRSVMAIATDLGFSERSAFHRAFRKWTGASPGEFRRRLRGV